MAGDWIKMREDLHEDPAVLWMAQKLGVGTDAIVGRCLRFWGLVSRQTGDGCLRGPRLSSLGEAIGYPGFPEMLVKVGWLEHDDSGEFPVTLIPKFERHLSESAKRRMVKAEQKRSERARKEGGCRDRVADLSPKTADKCPTREEKRREEIEEEDKDSSSLCLLGRAKDASTEPSEIGGLGETPMAMLRLPSLGTATLEVDPPSSPESALGRRAAIGRENGAQDERHVLNSTSGTTEPSKSHGGAATAIHSDGRFLASESDEEPATTGSNQTKKPMARRYRIGWCGETAKFTGVTDSDLARWKSAYPACDVVGEMRRASEWLLANPARAVKSNYQGFLTKWLTRSQDRGGELAYKANGSTKTNGTRKSGGGILGRTAAGTEGKFDDIDRLPVRTSTRFLRDDEDPDDLSKRSNRGL